MGHVYILKLRSKKWYVGYTERSSIERILEHIDKKGAKWTKKYPPLKRGYLHSFSKPGRTKGDEDRETLALMKKHGIANVRGGQWCMVNMSKEVYAELSAKIDKKPKKKYSPKKTPAKKKYTPKKTPAKKKASKKSKEVICARCNRIGHESKDCYAKTRVSGTGIFNDILRKGLEKK